MESTEDGPLNDRTGEAHFPLQRLRATSPDPPGALQEGGVPRGTHPHC